MANMSFGVNILPKSNNTYTLGNSDYKWNIFANTINGVNLSTLLLPTVTASDNGKILRVADGAWAIGDDLKLGETSSTAYRGDRGAAAYAAAVTNVDNTPTENSIDLVTSGGVYTALEDKIDRHYNTIDAFVPVEFNGFTEIDGGNIWTDGSNIYYSYFSDQYILDKSTLTWYPKVWNGLNDFDGCRTWTDGENIYYSNGSSQYVLDKSTSTWSTKLWNGLSNVDGYEIWKDGDNIYYSDGSDQYVLNKSTSTWSTKSWNGLTNFWGCDIWTDGDNIYYSYKSDQYVLNKSTSTWSIKTWNGLTEFWGSDVWTDGENIYCSAYSEAEDRMIQYVLDKSTSTWNTKSWDGFTDFWGSGIWTDGNNIYFSYYFSEDETGGNYKLGNNPQILLGTNGEFNVSSYTNLPGLLPSVQSSDNDKILKVANGVWSVGIMNADTTPTANSTNLITSGAVYNGLNEVSTAISNIILPTKVSDLNNDSGFLTSVPVMTGATSSAAGAAGLVPAPATTDVDKFLAGDGTYKSGGLPMVILSYGNSTWAEFEAAYNNNVIVYCRASSNSNPATGSQTRMAFMAYVNNATTPTEVEFQYYRSMSAHSATAMGDQVFVYKLTKTGGWSVTTRDASIKEINVATGSKLGVSWSSNKVTLSNTMTADDMPMSSSDATTTKAAIDALNNKLNATQITGSTKSAVESSLETFGSAMSNGEIRRIWFGISTASKPFIGTTYVGTIERQENRFVVLVNGISTVGQDLEGFYKSGTGWAWQSLNSKIAQLVTVTAKTGFSVLKQSLYQTGEQVSGTFEIRNASGSSVPANTWTTIGTVSKHAYSENTSSSSPAVDTGDGSFAGMVTIDTSGDIKVYSPISIATNHAICASVGYKAST